MVKMDNKCYVRAFAQISCQKPLSEEWLYAPIIYHNNYERAIEPDIKGLIAAPEARRMSKILKRAVCSALTVIKTSGISMPDAIITGTGTGCMENSEKFLVDINTYGENFLKPTLFIQSTHNTISSQIAITLMCYGYNNTYSHGAASFEYALLDAWLQIKNGQIATALVGSHDEVTPLMHRIFTKTHPDYDFISESSVSTMLSSLPRQGEDGIEVCDVFINDNISPEDIATMVTDNIIIIGSNGNALHDTPYDDVLKRLRHQPLVLRYKHIFGENFSSSAMAFYVGACLLKNQIIPPFLVCNGSNTCDSSVDAVTILNHSNNSTWSFIRLKKH